MHKTILAKLNVKEEDKLRLANTFADYKKAWQYVSEYVFQSKVKNRGKVHAATYPKLRESLPELNSGLIQQARNDAIAKFSGISGNRHKITRAPRLNNVSLRYDNRTASLQGNTLSFAVNGGKRIKASLVDFPKLQQHRTYKTLAPLIFAKDGQYWVALTFDVPENPGRAGEIMGVDLGLRILAATSRGKLIRGNKMNQLRRKVRHVKQSLQRKGTKSARRHIRRLGRKEQRQSRDVTHCAVNEILKSENVAVIAVEDLDLRAKKYRKNSNRRRFSVPLGGFLNILAYKAKLNGIQLVKVNPTYTSQDDCRGLEKGIRTGGKYLGKDGKILHSDINAACNIALKAKQLFNLDNPASVYYSSRQAAVNQPIACKSSPKGRVLQASTALARCS